MGRRNVQVLKASLFFKGINLEYFLLSFTPVFWATLDTHVSKNFTKEDLLSTFCAFDTNFLKFLSKSL